MSKYIHLANTMSVNKDAFEYRARPNWRLNVYCKIIPFLLFTIYV